MVLNPRTVIPHNLTAGQRHRLIRDALLYTLVIHHGWTVAEVAPYFGRSTKQIQRRIKAFSRYYAERCRGQTL